MKLYNYQYRAVDFLNEHPEAMLWVDMGLGKTVITLTSLWHRLDRMEVWGALVVAPKRVVESVWKSEIRKWPHLRDLRITNILGTNVDARTRAAMMPADIYVTNYEQLTWLANLWTKHYLRKGKYLPVNAIVWDEVPRLKNSTAGVSAAAQRLIPFTDYRIGLTGTPASNGYPDLHGQYLVVDLGARLGQDKTSYRKAYLEAENPMSPFGRQTVRTGCEDVIKSLIGDITLQMSNADYLELPPIIENEVIITLPPDMRAKYDKLEKDLWLRLDSGHEIESFNKASLMGRLLQFGQGAVYLTPGAQDWEEIHREKLYAMAEVVESAQGKPVLAVIQFRHDGYRLQKQYPDWVWIDSKMSAKKFNHTLDKWGSGDLPGIIIHPGSAGHGIDKLKNGPVDDLVWFGHTWRLDHYQQTPARLQRNGRTRPIRMHHLHVVDTVADVQRAMLTSKATTQDDLKAAVGAYRARRGYPAPTVKAA